MSKVGEATGGFGRFFGGISRAYVNAITPNFQFCPPLRALGTAAFDYDATLQAVRINAVGEGCTFVFRVPAAPVLVGKVLHLRLWAWYTGAGADLENFSLEIDVNCGLVAGAQAQQWTFQDETGGALLAMFDIPLDGTFHPVEPIPDQIMLVSIQYAAAGGGGNVTSIDVAGAEIYWI